MSAINYVETLPNGAPFEMIWVEGGAFAMGGSDPEAYDDEKPVHQVTLGSFYIGKFPVTQAVWKAVMGEDNNPSFFKGDQRPVEMVSWTNAQDFIKALNNTTHETRPPGHAYRLPTEAEWEFAARGGNKSKGYKYAGSNKLKEVGWYDENSHQETKAVGQKRPNELGLFDMSGNVLEWCWDWFGNYPEGEFLNPQGPDRGDYRVLRGGSWIYDARLCRASNRFVVAPADRFNFLGFRLVLSPLSVG